MIRSGLSSVRLPRCPRNARRLECAVGADGLAASSPCIEADGAGAIALADRLSVVPVYPVRNRRLVRALSRSCAARSRACSAAALRGSGCPAAGDVRKSVLWGQSVSVRVDLGGGPIITKKRNTKNEGERE